MSAVSELAKLRHEHAQVLARLERAEARVATLEAALRCDGTPSGKHEWRAGEYEDAREKNWCCRCARNATDLVDAALRALEDR